MKPPLTSEARRLLKRAVAVILKRPTTFDMIEILYHDVTVKPRTKADEPYCGTVGCLAGHIALLAVGRAPKAGEYIYEEREVPRRLRQLGELPGGRVDAYNMAIELVGRHASDRLFMTSDWPKRFYNAYHNRKTPIAKARVLAKRVDHYLKTGE